MTRQFHNLWRGVSGAKLSWDARAPAPYESAWSVFLKIAALNLLNVGELWELISPPAFRPDWEMAWRSDRQLDIETFAGYLNVSPERLRRGFIEHLGFDRPKWSRYTVRHCVECYRLGYHCSLFDLPFITHCPWHSMRLSNGCRICTRAISALSREGSETSMRWDCRDCGLYFDFNHRPTVNRLDAGIEAEIDSSVGELRQWWDRFQTQAGEHCQLARPIFDDSRDDVALLFRWCLGMIEAPRPPRWRFSEEPEPTRAVDSVRVCELGGTPRNNGGLQQQDYAAYRAIRRAIYARYLRPHRRCLKEISRFGVFECAGLDASRVCTAAVAYLCWRMAHEGCELDIDRWVLPRPPIPLRLARLGACAPDGPESTLRLLNANFRRIWSSLEAALQFRGVRVWRSEAQFSPCNLQYCRYDEKGARSAMMLVPDGEILNERALVRCDLRRLMGLPMYRPESAFAHGGWNAVPDVRSPFTIRHFDHGKRNTYWQLEI